MTPHWNGTPSRYQPNPDDDRALNDGKHPLEAAAYFQLAVAIEAITEDLDGNTYKTLHPQTRRAIRTAEHALRRAALGVVIFTEDR